VVAAWARTPEAITYDEDGNLTRDGRWVYEYDAENRLAVMFTRGAPDDPDETQTANAAVWTSGVARQKLVFTYDYLGRRVQKTTYYWEATPAGWVLDEQRKFVYNGWHLIATLDATDSNALMASYAWGLDLSGTIGGAGGVGGLLLVQEGGTTYLPAYDAMGNVHAMIKASDGTIAAAYEYDAFGRTLRESGSYAADNPFRFSTKYTDIETGLVYHETRFYSADLGRFLNRDSIGEQGGLNLYAYVSNRVPNAWDYLGMFEWYYEFNGQMMHAMPHITDAPGNFLTADRDAALMAASNTPGETPHFNDSSEAFAYERAVITWEFMSPDERGRALANLAVGAARQEAAKYQQRGETPNSATTLGAGSGSTTGTVTGVPLLGSTTGTGKADAWVYVRAGNQAGINDASTIKSIYKWARHANDDMTYSDSRFFKGTSYLKDEKQFVFQVVDSLADLNRPDLQGFRLQLIVHGNDQVGGSMFYFVDGQQLSPQQLAAGIPSGCNVVGPFGCNTTAGPVLWDNLAEQMIDRTKSYLGGPN
jgi:RHS repeat-associated protein